MTTPTTRPSTTLFLTEHFRLYDLLHLLASGQHRRARYLLDRVARDVALGYNRAGPDPGGPIAHPVVLRAILDVPNPFLAPSPQPCLHSPICVRVSPSCTLYPVTRIHQTGGAVHE